jgi:nitrous oxide reductase accessory protein NosL
VRRLAVLAVVLATAAAAAAPALAASDTSVTDISDEVMCVVCGVPLNVAGGPQADRERAHIQDLIDQEGKVVALSGGTVNQQLLDDAMQ